MTTFRCAEALLGRPLNLSYVHIQVLTDERNAATLKESEYNQYS